MGLFDKKYCDICGEKIGLLGNRKLDDGNMCKDCARLLSPFTTDRRKTSLADIKAHLAYREDNKSHVAAFNLTRTIGETARVLLDEDAGQFIVTSSGNWQNDNPDVIKISQVTSCQIEIRENKTEEKRRDADGKQVSYSPPRYDFDYDFYITIHVNSPWFDEIKFKLNDRRIDRRSSGHYRETEQQANEIRSALTQVRHEARQEVRGNTANVGTPKIALTCPYCGATTTPDASGACAFCGGTVQG